MPRNVRIELDVDGKASRVETGPKSKTGGFSLIIRQRDGGSIATAARINGFADESTGTLRLEITAGVGDNTPSEIIIRTQR